MMRVIMIEKNDLTADIVGYCFLNDIEVGSTRFGWAYVECPDDASADGLLNMLPESYSAGLIE